jgi:transcriptional regulator with GAF, ATPase, and Fis domain
VSQPVLTDISTHAAEPNGALPTDLVLVVVTGQARGQRAKLGDRLRVGKSSDNDLVLPDDTVSRHHCEIVRTPRGLVVRDLGSTNQTRIGRSKVTEATLEPGATLTIGDVELVLRSDARRMSIMPSNKPRFGDVVGPSLAMRSVFGVLERIAPTDATVLLEGETGTGKDVIARSVHSESLRKAQPFVVVDCGAVSYNLIESELFGHERGSFTGAVATRAGAFENAGKGTLFLDEVGELPLDVQPKLLRVLESGEFRKVGGNRPQKSEARIVAATKRNLKEEVDRGKFREDLYFRLAVMPITVPPLRQRREDVPALVDHFLEVARKRDPRMGDLTIGPETRAALSAHDWPGNVRELRNVLDRALYVASAGGEHELRIVDVPVAAGSAQAAVAFDPARSYREVRASFEADFEQAYVSWLLGRHDGNISAAAREAKMDRKYLYDLARKRGLRGTRE